eukprot:SAG11_NODE_5660_length_1492_cov_1.636037_1_plen_218_part_00
MQTIRVPMFISLIGRSSTIGLRRTATLQLQPRLFSIAAAGRRTSGLPLGLRAMPTPSGAVAAKFPHAGFSSSSAASDEAVDVNPVNPPGSMPDGMHELSNEALLIMSSHGNHDATTEVLARDIMHKDSVNYQDAYATIEKIRAEIASGSVLYAIPSALGITVRPNQQTSANHKSMSHSFRVLLRRSPYSRSLQVVRPRIFSSIHGAQHPDGTLGSEF